MQACILDSVCATGNCQFCEQQADCVLLNMVRKLDRLQATLDSLKDRLPAESNLDLV